MNQAELTLLIWGWSACGFVVYLLIRSWWKRPDDGHSLKWTNAERVWTLFLAVIASPVLPIIGLVLWSCIGIKLLFTKEWWEEEVRW